jgi:mannose-6-phosphate isomerase-like protein (cupin superfamily)
VSEAPFAKAAVKRVDKPWGFELIWAKADRYVGKLLHINAGEALSFQYHEVKEETIYVLHGALTLHVARGDDEPSVMELTEGEVFHITPGLRHRFEAKVEVELLEVSTPELDDVVRLEDRYGRVGQ